MAKLHWDEIGQRLYEAGIDRGVLYLADNHGVPWNGLTSVQEDFEETSDPLYFDGVKYLDNLKIGDFSATLTAFTYPDEFLEHEGLTTIDDGVYTDGQDAIPFDMSFRTLVGNDAEGLSHGYKIHILYNLTAVPDDKSYQSMSGTPTPNEFSWKITGVPEKLFGYRPTMHVILDSRFLNPELLETIEDIIYGVGPIGHDAVYDGGYAPEDFIYDGGPVVEDGPLPIDGGDTEAGTGIIIDSGGPSDEPRPIIDGGDSDDVSPPLPDEVFVDILARLPPIDELFGLVTLYGPRRIVPHTDTGIADLLEDDDGDITQVQTAGVYSALPGSRLVQTEVSGIYHLV